jgi:hypothetical protein
MDHLKRLAIVIKETGEVSSISEMSQGRIPGIDKGKERTHEIVPVADTVSIGMLRQPDGSFDWPPGHPNESGATRHAREAANQPQPEDAA